MTTLRYLLSLIAILSVVNVSAATYGKPYQPQQRGSRYAMNYSQMPTLSMSTLNASMMNSGSALPMAAITGTITADQASPSGPRRIGESGGFADEDPTEGQGDTNPPVLPGDTVPLGNEILPLMLLAMMYAAWIAIKRRRKANS